MSVLVLGGEGMLGHALVRACAGRAPILGPVAASVRGTVSRVPFAPGVRVAAGVDALRFATVEAAVEAHRPTAIVNAIGIVKKRPEGEDRRLLAAVNARFPRRLAALCRARGIRLVHVSTDCVFDGRRGGYAEDDAPTARDRYGRSKARGEVVGPDILTLRTSMVGLEPVGARGLLAFLLAARGRVRGYTNVVFSGPTAPEVARTVVAILASGKPFGGLVHLGAEPIDKHALLLMLRDALALPIGIDPDPAPRLDRSLRATRLWLRYAIAAPSWPDMVDELARLHRAGNPPAATPRRPARVAA